MAISCPFLVSPNLETTLLNHHDPSPLSLIGIPMTNNRTMRCLIGFQMRRGLIQSELSASKASSVSALDQLKSSAIDRYTKEKSSIVVIGLNIHTASVEMREKLAIPEAEWLQAISELRGLNHIEQAAVLSTCNRIEIYVLALSRHRGVKEVTEWMSKRSGIPVSEICQHRFLLYNNDATQHLFQVSAGLDSLVLGEGQILAQVRHVVSVGDKGFGRVIKGLFDHAISAGSRVRSETNISSGAVSVSSAAVELALANLPESSSPAKMLVIGAGKMGKLVIKHLVAKGYDKMVVVNRSQEKVEPIREEMMSLGVEIVYKPFDEMLACAAEANVIFTSTASEKPLFLKEHVNILPPNARLFVDISVPRNVGSCVAEVDGARVYNVDDLKEVVAANKEERARKAMRAQPIITEETKKFEESTDSLEVMPTIKKLRKKTERIIVTEVEKFVSSKLGIEINEETRKRIDSLSESIMNKVLHGPMKHLRCDESVGRTLSETLENMKALNRMFELDAELLEEKIRGNMKPM